MTRILWPLVFALPLLASDLKQLRSEPNLEHRAQLALQQAAQSFSEAKTDYAAGNRDKTAHDLDDMQTAVEIARSALTDTGKNPRKHTKPFKLAETETRDLLRRLDGLENSMDLDDRKLIESPKAKVQEAHDEWLNEIISGRK